MQLALSDGDEVITSYRDHGHMLATGMDPRGVMAELTGRATGYSRGKGGSMHMFSLEKKFFGGHGIVGAQVSIGTGLAFSNHYRGNDRVCVTYLGEGASNQGQVFESFNLAALLKLPCIYVIENNRYGMGTSVERSSASRDLSQNGAPWRHPRRAGGRHGRVRRSRRGAGRGGALPRRQRPLSDGNENLPLSRPFHVRSGEIPHARGSAANARAARPDRPRPRRPARRRRYRGRAQTHRGRNARHRAGRCRHRPKRPGPDEAELWTDVLAGG